MSKIVHKELSFRIVGAAMEVHNILGPGYLEAVYQSALAHELSLQGIPFVQFKKLPVIHKGKHVGDYEADFMIGEDIILELKALSILHPKHEAQAINYLTATGLKLAILLNFGEDSLQIKRLVK